MKLPNWIKRIECWLDGHTVSDEMDHVAYGSGDGYDRFGKCDHCGQMCHKDLNMFGHEGWKVDD